MYLELSYRCTNTARPYADKLKLISSTRIPTNEHTSNAHTWNYIFPECMYAYLHLLWRAGVCLCVSAWKSKCDKIKIAKNYK